MTYRKIEHREEEYCFSDDFYEIRNSEDDLIAIILDRGKRLGDSLATLVVTILNNFEREGRFCAPVDSDITIENWECQCSDCIRKRAEQAKL